MRAIFAFTFVMLFLLLLVAVYPEPTPAQSVTAVTSGTAPSGVTAIVINGKRYTGEITFISPQASVLLRPETDPKTGNTTIEIRMNKQAVVHLLTR